MAIADNLIDQLLQKQLDKQVQAPMPVIGSPDIDFQTASNPEGMMSAGMANILSSLRAPEQREAIAQQARAEAYNQKLAREQDLQDQATRSEEARLARQHDAAQAKLDREYVNPLDKFTLDQKQTALTTKQNKDRIFNSLLTPELAGASQKELLAEARKDKNWKPEYASDLLARHTSETSNLLSGDQGHQRYMQGVNEQIELGLQNIGQQAQTLSQEFGRTMLAEGINPSIVETFQQDMAQGFDQAGIIDDLMSKVGADEEPIYEDRDDLIELYNYVANKTGGYVPSGIFREAAALSTGEGFFKGDTVTSTGEEAINNLLTRAGFGDADQIKKMQKYQDAYKGQISEMVNWQKKATKSLQDTYRGVTDKANKATISSLRGKAKEYAQVPSWETVIPQRTSSIKEAMAKIVQEQKPKPESSIKIEPTSLTGAQQQAIWQQRIQEQQ